MAKEIISTDKAPKAIGTYSQAVKTGSTVYLSGQIPLVPETMEMVEGDISNKIILRKKDEGKDLAQKINVFNDILSDKLVIIENFNANIAVATLQLKKKLEDSGIDDNKFVPSLNEIQNSQKNIQTMINDYTFPKEKL